MRIILVLVFLWIATPLLAQQVVELDQGKTIRLKGQVLTNGFSLGINSAQIQTLDLTVDGKEEWVVWDINSRQLQVFEKKGEQFLVRPELSYFFPSDVSGFLVLADFDRDGKKDLFTSTALGVKAYRNTSSGSQISWTLAQNFLRLEGANNIPANNLDTPLLQDLDGDGDLDLLLFNFAVGDYLEYYRNTSIERKGSSDIDGFAFPIRHWGNFEFCGCGQISFGLTCDGRSLATATSPLDQARVQHAGGHSLLYRDFTGDGIPDLLMGREECSTLYFLPNIGTSSNPKFTSFSKELPGFGSLPEFPRFQVGQFLEESLLVSLNTNETAAAFGVDFAQSIVRLEKGTGKTLPILQDQVLDLGENTRPFFNGTSFSGELLVTANGKKGTKVLGQAYRMQYTGTQLELVEDDYLGLSGLNLLDLSLLDYTSVAKENHLLVLGTRISNIGVPAPVLLKRMGANWEEFTLAGLNLRLGDQLSLVGYQGKDQLLVAAQNGSLTLYEVDLTARSVRLLASNFLGFQDNPANRNLNVTVHGGERPDLYSVDQTGRIYRTRDFLNTPVREEVLVRIQNQELPMRLGRSNWLAVVNSSLGEEDDLILGTRGGGLLYLSAASSNGGSAGEFSVTAFPNPSSGSFQVVSSLPATGRLISPLGQVLLSEIILPSRRAVLLDIPNLASGMYFLQLQTDDKQTVVQKIWVR
ncbi:MAG: T9SS type A sorting domain-containing protein [Algoriphagus sp.]|nr:T9SS type A sorting domain-containing protein [Algoriphagus sp.]MCE2777979.1 T9SS type A sorting domain-containing protein [Algoriphagus sp.]